MEINGCNQWALVNQIVENKKSEIISKLTTNVEIGV